MMAGYDYQNRRRHSVRLKGYDYGQPGAYFITICTHGRECVLGEITEAAAKLSGPGRIVDQCWRALPQYFPDIELDVFAIMPNHVHGIILVTRVGSIPAREGEAFGTNIGSQEGAQIPNASPLHLQRLPRGTQNNYLGAIVPNFKSVSARKINQLRSTLGVPVWQRNYYEHVIRSDVELDHTRKYICDNVVKWKLDENNPESLGDCKL